MKAINSSTFLGLLMIFCSCNNTPKHTNQYADTYKSHIIDVTKTQKMENIGDWIKEIRFIPLETTEKSLISRIEKVMYHKGDFYVHDKQTRSIKVFDKYGKYKRTIGKLGRGPGEYSTLRDFTFNSENKTLLLLSNNEQSVFEYDLEGNFIKKIKTNLFASSLAKVHDTYYYHVNQNDNKLSGNYNLIAIDKSGKIINRFFPYPKTFNVMMDNAGFVLRNNIGALYNSALSDTVFQLTENSEIYPKYIFNFGENALPDQARKSYEEFSKVRKEYKYSYLLNRVFESKNTLAFSYMDGRKVISAYYKKTSQKIHEKLNPSIVRFRFPLGFSPVGLMGEDKFITYLPASFLNWLDKGSITSKSVKNLFPGLYKLIPQLKVSDNPILVVYELRVP